MWKRTGALVITWWLAASTAAAPIYHCVDSRGAPLFTQYPCGDDARVVQISQPSVIDQPALTESERRTLQQIDRESAGRRQAASRRAQRARRQDIRERLRQADDCAAGRAALAVLRRQKRRGYSLQDARALEAQEARLKEQVDGNC